MLCHGRGREFESRRLCVTFQKSGMNFVEIVADPNGALRAIWALFTLRLTRLLYLTPAIVTFRFTSYQITTDKEVT